MTNDDFAECDTCRQKPGSPLLCERCLHNRALVSALKDRAQTWEDYAVRQRAWAWGLTVGVIIVGLCIVIVRWLT